MWATRWVRVSYDVFCDRPCCPIESPELDHGALGYQKPICVKLAGRENLGASAGLDAVSNGDRSVVEAGQIGGAEIDRVRQA